MHVICASRQWRMLNQVYDLMREAGGVACPDVWCQLIIGAGKANRPDWARTYFDASVVSHSPPCCKRPFCLAKLGTVILWCISGESPFSATRYRTTVPQNITQFGTSEHLSF